MEKVKTYLGANAKLSLLFALTIYFVLPYQTGVQYHGGIITTIILAFALFALSLGLVALLSMVCKAAGFLRDDFTKRQARYILNPILIVATATALSLAASFYPTLLGFDNAWDNFIAGLVLVSVPHWINRTFRSRVDDSKLVFAKSKMTPASLGQRFAASSCIFAFVFYFVFSQEQGFTYMGGLFYSFILGACFSLIELILLAIAGAIAKQFGLMKETDTQGDVKPFAFSTLIICVVLGLHFLSRWFPNTLQIAGFWHLFIGSIVLIGVSSWIGDYFRPEKDDTQPFIEKRNPSAA